MNNIILTNEFPSDSKLETIDENAFCSSTHKNIIILSSIASIGEGAFSYCRQLDKILNPNDLNLFMIPFE